MSSLLLRFFLTFHNFRESLRNDARTLPGHTHFFLTFVQR